MDPNKSASAPPAAGFAATAGEKSAPPPYQDHPQYPNAGYPPQPGPAYQGQGYDAAQPGYGPPPPQQMYGPPQPYPAGQTYPAGQPYPVGQPYGPPGTVVVQPTVFVTRTALTQPASDYLGYSIFTMLCCCLPLGIAALIYSVSARKALSNGDMEAAAKNSVVARNLNIASVVVGIIIIVAVLVFEL